MRRLRSLSTRLLLLFLAAAGAVVLAIGLGFKVGVSEHMRNQVEPHLLAYLDYLQQDLGSPPDPRRAARLAERLPLDISLQGPQLDWSSPGFKTAKYPRRYPRRHGHFAVGHRGGYSFLRRQHGDYTTTWRVRARPHRGLTAERIAVFAGVVLTLLALYLLIRYLLRPLHSLTDGVRRIGSGALDTRINVVRGDEIGELTEAVNGMAGQLEQMLEAKRQLLLAISHELRSPITRARVSAELLGDSQPRNAIVRDLDTMAQLIDELLEGERLNGSHAALQTEPLIATQLLQTLLAESYPDSGIKLVDHSKPDPLALDPARLRLLLRNLIDNALAHTPAGDPPPTISLESLAAGTASSAEGIQLTVHNHGPAIAAEHLPHLTEPFYRADPSRRRATGGYGLGLWLCRAIAEAHNGELSLHSDQQGTQVTVILRAQRVAE